MRQIRKQIRILFAILLIVSLSFQVYAATETIVFDRTGITSKCDEKLTNQNITCTTARNKKFAISTVYIKNIENANFQLKPSVTLAIANYGFLGVKPTKALTENGAVSVEDLSGISVDAKKLDSCGFDVKNLSPNCAYYFIGIVGTPTGNNFGILIQVKQSSSGLTDDQKAPLKEIYDSVTGDKEKNWYQTGDRYNGNKADTITDRHSGFWAEFTKKDGPRDQAKATLEASTTTEADIKAAAAKLTAARAKLIPKTELNATKLYEALQDCNYADEYLETFTKPSVEKFLAARCSTQHRGRQKTFRPIRRRPMIWPPA